MQSHEQTDISRPTICPGEVWTDLEGKPIQAHGGGLIEHQGYVYWFGEDKAGPTTKNSRGGSRVPFLGMACYRSRDLIAWERVSTALHPVADDPQHQLHPSKVNERPKVIFDPSQQRFVMWFKAGGADYEYMHLGVAVSDHIEGPYRFLRAEAPNGLRAGDFALLRDEHGTPHILHPSEGFSVIIVAELTLDATGFTGDFHRCLETSGGFDGHEAPAVFRHDGRWYMITSRVSGWDPNACRVCVAERLTGQWRVMGELCDTQVTDTTFASQPACVWPVDPERGRFIYVGDRWNKEDLGDSRYVWLPLRWTKDRPSLSWTEAWHPAEDGGWSE